jgi:hypothetical protein
MPHYTITTETNYMHSFLLAQSEAAQSSGGAGVLIFLVLYFAFIIFLIASFWKIFTKAGQPGWAAIVPIYNLVVLLQIVGRPVWWIVLMLIPLVNLVILVMVAIDLAKSFGKGAGFGIGLAFLGFIFYPILGFGSAKYAGPAAAK